MPFKKDKILVLALLFLVVGLWGCTKCSSTPVTCDTASKYSDQVATYVAPLLGCTGVAAISADITAQLQKDNLCSAATAKTGPVASIVCPPVVSFIVGYGAGKLPAAWQCTGGAAATWTAQTLTEACDKIPY